MNKSQAYLKELNQKVNPYIHEFVDLKDKSGSRAPAIHNFSKDIGNLLMQNHPEDHIKYRCRNCRYHCIRELGPHMIDMVACRSH